MVIGLVHRSGRAQTPPTSTRVSRRLQDCAWHGLRGRLAAVGQLTDTHGGPRCTLYGYHMAHTERHHGTSREGSHRAAMSVEAAGFAASAAPGHIQTGTSKPQQHTCPCKCRVAMGMSPMVLPSRTAHPGGLMRVECNWRDMINMCVGAYLSNDRFEVDSHRSQQQKSSTVEFEQLCSMSRTVVPRQPDRGMAERAHGFSVGPTWTPQQTHPRAD